MDKIYMSLGTLVGVLLGFAIAILILTITKKDHKLRSKYDERQILNRGKCFKALCIILAVEFGVNMYIDIVEILLPVPLFILYAVELCCAAMVFITLAIHYEAYWALNEDRPKVMIYFVVIAIANLALFVFGKACLAERKDEPAISLPYINLICCILLVYASIVSAVHNYISNKSGRGDEPDENGVGED